MDSCKLLQLIGRFNVIGAVRLHKYAYLLSRQTYDDWVRNSDHHYSQKLTRDLQDCIADGLVLRSPSRDIPSYSLTQKGMNVLDKEQAAKTDAALEKLQALELDALLGMVQADTDDDGMVPVLGSFYADR